MRYIYLLIKKSISAFLFSLKHSIKHMKQCIYKLNMSEPKPIIEHTQIFDLLCCMTNTLALVLKYLK